MNSSSQALIETIRQRPVKGDDGFALLFAICSPRVLRLDPLRPGGNGPASGPTAFLAVKSTERGFLPTWHPGMIASRIWQGPGFAGAEEGGGHRSDFTPWGFG